MAKFNNENKRFSSAPNALINDDTIPDRARFIYVYMNAKPEGWEFFHEPMAKALKIGIDTLKKYIDILVDRGWLERGEQQNEKGKFGAVEYTLKAVRKRPSNKNTDTEKYRNGKIPQQYINSSINTPLNEDNSIIPNPVIDKERKRLSNDNQKAPDELFLKFWESYGYKKGKDKAVKAWNRLTKKEKEEAIKCISIYKIDCAKNDRSMQYPSTYLNQKTWNDDFDSCGKVGSYDVLPEDDEKVRRFKKWMREKHTEIEFTEVPLTFDGYMRLQREYGMEEVCNQLDYIDANIGKFRSSDIEKTIRQFFERL